MNVVFLPKFHCECNPIEGLWCSQESFIRQRSDQTYQKMLQLIPMSRIHFVKTKLYVKLIRRFLKTLEAYHNGSSYGEVLKIFFSHLCKSDSLSHRNISNSNL